MATAHVLGIPFSSAGPLSGTDQAPSCLRNAGLRDAIQNTEASLRDHGDVILSIDDVNRDAYRNVRHPRLVGAATHQISDSIYNILTSAEVSPGDTTVILGGDRSITMGTIHGHMRKHPEAVVVWVDAHADIHPPVEYTSGHMYAMPLAFLVPEVRNNEVPKDFPGLEWLIPCLNPDKLIYIGLRSLPPPQRRILSKYGIAAYGMHDIDRLGIGGVMQQVMKYIHQGESASSIHLSVDCDALDPSVAPCTGVQVPGGLKLREICYIAEELAATGSLYVMDITEFNPQLGSPNDVRETSQTIIELIGAAFGKRRLTQTIQETTRF